MDYIMVDLESGILNKRDIVDKEIHKLVCLK